MEDFSDEGYINLWRKSLKSIVFEKPELWKFWTWCLMKATWKPYKVLLGLQAIDIQPGQFIFGRKKAVKDCKGVSEQQIRNFIKLLVKEGNITIKVTNKFSIITICNWESYQDNKTVKNHQKNQQRTNKEPHTRRY